MKYIELGLNDRGIATRASIIPQGTVYGSLGKLTADRDLLHLDVKTKPNGDWFGVANWYVETIKEHERGTGWCIEGSARDWDLTADQVNKLLDQLEG